MRTSCLVLAALLAASAQISTERARRQEPASPAVFAYEQQQIVLGSAERQTVLAGFLLGGVVADLGVVSIDENDVRRLRIYAFGDGTWAPALDATLGREVLFIDVANIGGRDRLVTYEPGQLNWFDPKSATERPLVAVAADFTTPRRNEVPHVDVTRDVNGDDRDDLVVPGADGFRVFVQRKDGAFSEPVKIGLPPKMSRILGADGYRYDPWSQSRIHEIDYNQDGRGDLVFWNRDHFEVHLQGEHGLFDPTPETFTTEVAFDFDHLDAVATGDMHGRVLSSLTDLDGDGVGDLIVFSLTGKRVSSKRSSYEVHFGSPLPDGGTLFSRGVDMTLQSDGGIQLGMDRHDLDDDGQIDVMITTIEVGNLRNSLWRRLKGLFGDDVWLELEFYRMDGGRYPDAPDAVRRISLDGVPSHREPGWVPLDLVLRGGTHESRRAQKNWPRAFNMLLLVGDATGDGRADLFIGKNTPAGMDVFVGVPGPELFARQAQDVPVVVPNDREYAWLMDLNNDGKQDILMHDPFPLRDAHGAPWRLAGTEPHRLTLLIAR